MENWSYESKKVLIFEDQSVEVQMQFSARSRVSKNCEGTFGLFVGLAVKAGSDLFSFCTFFPPIFHVIKIFLHLLKEKEIKNRLNTNLKI